MKRKAIAHIVSTALLITVLTTGGAFAMEGQGNLVQGDLTTLSEQGSAVTQPGGYINANISTSGTVSEVTKKDNTYTIWVDNKDGGIVFHSKSDVFVIDQKTKKVVTLDSIKKGATLTAIYPKLSPMMLSLPPQTSSAIGFVITDDQASLNHSTFNDELVNTDNSLKLNVSKDTIIVSAKGEKKTFTAEDLKNKELVVLYTITTRSIPAQTNPEMVIILGDAEVADVTPIAPAGDSSATEVTYVPLREAVEAKGYTIEWTSNKKPILLKKNDLTVTITIGSTEVGSTHMTKDLKPIDTVKLTAPVKLVGGKTMVPNTLIEAL